MQKHRASNGEEGNQHMFETYTYLRLLDMQNQNLFLSVKIVSLSIEYNLQKQLFLI